MSPMKMCFDTSYCYFTESQYILNIKSTFKSWHEGHLVMAYYFHKLTELKCQHFCYYLHGEHPSVTCWFSVSKVVLASVTKLGDMYPTRAHMRTAGMAQVAECLLYKFKPLSSNTSPTKKYNKIRTQVRMFLFYLTLDWIL
jgi:hypothetical protein